MAGRWHLHRAGILNVYQYGDETIDLAGGRLLLRGVNGSGKSTAMNMLLPFLIEADVRRIDAAGEQTGVLRSWMLSGREEPNPVGYLWIEFERVEDQTGELRHLVCGCGIRASASTERPDYPEYLSGLDRGALVRDCAGSPQGGGDHAWFPGRSWYHVLCSAPVALSARAAARMICPVSVCL